MYICTFSISTGQTKMVVQLVYMTLYNLGELNIRKIKKGILYRYVAR